MFKKSVFRIRCQPRFARFCLDVKIDLMVAAQCNTGARDTGSVPDGTPEQSEADFVKGGGRLNCSNVSPAGTLAS